MQIFHMQTEMYKSNHSPNICVLVYLVLVCGIKIIPRLRVVGLVPAKHTTTQTELG